MRLAARVILSRGRRPLTQLAEAKMPTFMMGQVYERTMWSAPETAKVIAIVDGGRTGWLRVDGSLGSPFELTPAHMLGWTPQQKRT
jgi:hypothetical protein